LYGGEISKNQDFRKKAITSRRLTARREARIELAKKN
jgi:hypothetical protein